MFNSWDYWYSRTRNHGCLDWRGMAMQLWASRLVLAELGEVRHRVWHETSEYALKAVKESAMEALKASSPSSKLWKQPWCSSLIFYSLIFFYSSIQLIGLSLHIQITINKTQIKDPIHCSVFHQKLFPSNFEALERVLELPSMGLEWLIILWQWKPSKDDFEWSFFVTGDWSKPRKILLKTEKGWKREKIMWLISNLKICSLSRVLRWCKNIRGWTGSNYNRIIINLIII